jgi:hypothetical protein
MGPPRGQPHTRRVEFLDDEPARLTRPLALLDGRAYATTWLTVRVHDQPPPTAVDAASPASPAPGDGVSGEPTAAAADEPPPTEPPAAVVTARRPYVLRDDGVLFGDGADHPLAGLGLELCLYEPPRADRLWRRPAVDRYRRGERPDAVDVFTRLVGCYDAFVAFGRSLADQATMCQLCACCTLATWLADAFAVLPYLWLTGERGSGKTQLGTVWAMTSYLGETLLAGSSYPTLRDLAEFGAALYFDDAEAVVGGRRGDPLKRELLLAGNRRGAQVALKVATPEGWRTRWVDAFTPRAFSAIALPDATLGSRAIVVPLSRSRDPRRGQRDPADPAAWPCDRLALQDDLWALGLSLLPEATRAWRALDAETDLVGREYQKWRPLLAVAALLEARGVDGLVARLRAAMAAYREDRLDLVAADETTELVQGLVLIAERALALKVREFGQAGGLDYIREAVLTVENWLLLESARRAVPEGTLARRHELAGRTRVGQLMARLRFERARASDSGRARGWSMTVASILDVARAYGVPSHLFEHFPDTPDTSPAAAPAPAPVVPPAPPAPPPLSPERVRAAAGPPIPDTSDTSDAFPGVTPHPGRRARAPAVPRRRQPAPRRRPRRPRWS